MQTSWIGIRRRERRSRRRWTWTQRLHGKEKLRTDIGGKLMNMPSSCSGAKWALERGKMNCFNQTVHCSSLKIFVFYQPFDDWRSNHRPPIYSDLTQNDAYMSYQYHKHVPRKKTGTSNLTQCVNWIGLRAYSHIEWFIPGPGNYVHSYQFVGM